MNMYWTLQSIPELRDLPRYQARALYRQNVWKPLRRWQLWAAFALTLATVAGATALLWSIGLRDTLPELVLRGLLAIGIPGVVFEQVRMHMVRPYLRATRDDLT